MATTNTGPTCGCCATPAEYVGRHIDTLGALRASGLSAPQLAREIIGMYGSGSLPPHMPDVYTLGLWIAEYQGPQGAGVLCA